jgi:hypothetical protein
MSICTSFGAKFESDTRSGQVTGEIWQEAGRVQAEFSEVLKGELRDGCAHFFDGLFQACRKSFLGYE